MQLPHTLALLHGFEKSYVGSDLEPQALELTVRVLPRQANEFTCASCFLVKSMSQLAETKGDLRYCVDCV